MTKNSEIRIDTFLWAIRIFKSRTLAAEAIKGSKVKLNNDNIKPSRIVKIGDVYAITISPQNKKVIEVKSLTDKRSSSEIAKQHYYDHTPVIEKSEKADRAFFTMNIKQDKGSGRPTKRNRRDLGKEGGWF
jgi:ribosome-associated heat shock protein Hsp15